MTIQNLFYLSGIIVFSLTALLVLFTLLAGMRLNRRAQDLMDRMEDKMSNQLTGFITQLIPLGIALVTGLIDRNKRSRR